MASAASTAGRRSKRQASDGAVAITRSKTLTPIDRANNGRSSGARSREPETMTRQWAAIWESTPKVTHR